MPEFAAFKIGTPEFLEDFGQYRCAVCGRVYDGLHRPVKGSSRQGVGLYALCPSCYCETHWLRVEDIRTDDDAQYLFKVSREIFLEHVRLVGANVDAMIARSKKVVDRGDRLLDLDDFE